MLNIFPNLNLYILVNSMIIKNYVKLLSVKLKLLKAYYNLNFIYFLTFFPSLFGYISLSTKA